MLAIGGGGEEQRTVRNQQIVLLDGISVGNDYLIPVLAMLMRELQCDGVTLQTFSLRPYVGFLHRLFWLLKKPGVCLEPDVGREIAQAVMQGDMTILLTSVTFSGYSSAIKNMQDRWIPLAVGEALRSVVTPWRAIRRPDAPP